MDRAATRAAALAEARRWIGTPYRHQASLRGAGSDCLGLIRGVWRALHGDEPEPTPPYSPDWAERSGETALLAAAARHLDPLEIGAAEPGDVILLRPFLRGPVKHCAILDRESRMIHAYHGRAVTASALSPWWRARIAAAGAFPIPHKD